MRLGYIAPAALLAGAVFLAACANGSHSGVALAKRRPNIVFVLLDDVRYDDVIDLPFANLPNLKRIAREGASFQRSFTSAPLCSPSRAIFMTGQYAWRNGIIDNAERGELSHRIVTFPKLLHDAGYHTGFFGKWHMSHEDDAPRPGFDRWVSFVGQGVYFNPELNIDGRSVKATGYMTDLLTDHAIAFIDSAPPNQPFLVYVAQKAVHPEIYPNNVRTFPPAPGDEHLYAGATPHHGASWHAPITGKPALARPYDHSDPRSPDGGLPDSVIMDRLRMLSAVDRSLGRLIATLESKRILDETVFIVTSDQGFFYGEFGLAQERRLSYDPSTHIPLLIRYPSLVKAGAKPEAVVSNVDLAPTLLELGGAISANMDGKSLVPVLSGHASSVRDDMLVEYYSDTEFPRVAGMGYKAVRTTRYKYIKYDALKGMDELYDLRADPSELTNLLPDRAPPGVLADMTTRMTKLLGRPSADHPH